MIYLDNAATSGQKPENVYVAVNDTLRNVSGNPGRSGHKVSLEAGKRIYEARLSLSRLFHAENAESIAFCLNATDALNTAIKGVINTNGHIITSSIEHNSVSRPLEYMRELGTEITKISASIDDGVDPDEIKKAIKANTSLVVINHVSNVTGTVNDIKSIGNICHDAGVPFLVDASQSAGALPIDVQSMHIDMLAFPGHKSLLGPQGTGGLYIRPGLDIAPFKHGGTGSLSELLTQPEIRPDKFESGTLNVPGIAGLAEGIKFIEKEKVENIETKEKIITEKLIEGLSELPGVRIYAPALGKRRGAVVSITIDGIDPQDIGMILDNTFDIAVRPGLHCSPDAHRTIGTLYSGGTLRISPGFFTTEAEIEQCIDAIRLISEGI